MAPLISASLALSYELKANNVIAKRPTFSISIPDTVFRISIYNTRVSISLKLRLLTKENLMI